MQKFSFDNPYAKMYNALRNELTTEKELLQAQVGEFDKQQEVFLHLIENEELTDEEAVKTVTAIKKLRNERRKAKVALSQISIVLATMKKDFSEETTQKYKYNEEVLKEAGLERF